MEALPRFTGNFYEVGLAHGRMLRSRLETVIDHYIGGLTEAGALDVSKLASGSMAWYRTLPMHYQEELQGMADGADFEVDRLAEWFYAELCRTEGCSAFMGVIDGDAWIGRNNDADWFPAYPAMWGHVVVREITGRIPTLIIGVEGEVFVATGINREKLWLHYNYLPDLDPPDESLMPCFVWAREALETCSSIAEIERLLAAIPRYGGMSLFVADGKTNEMALFECSGRHHVRRQPEHSWLVATNHYCATRISSEMESAITASSTLSRYQRLNHLLRDQRSWQLPDDVIQLLEDQEVEQARTRFGTVYACVACPAHGQLWLASGAFPAASRGTWRPIAWPWS